MKQQINWIDQSSTNDNNLPNVSEKISNILSKMSISEITQRITSSEKQANNIINYFIYLNLYLSKQFYGHIGNFITNQKEIDQHELKAFKELIKLAIRENDQFIFNLKKLSEQYTIQQEILKKMLLSMHDIRYFWRSFFDSPNVQIANIMFSIWYEYDKQEQREYFEIFENFLYKKIKKYEQEILDFLESQS